LIHQIEQVCLIVRSSSISGSNPAVCSSSLIYAKRATIISIVRLSMDHLLALSAEIVIVLWRLIHLISFVAYFNLLHKVSISKSLSKLVLLIRLSNILVLVGSKSSHPCLIEDLLFLIHLVDIGKHLMNPRIVSRLQEHAMLGGVHLINA
jgi:hypothetical protein